MGFDLDRRTLRFMSSKFVESFNGLANVCDMEIGDVVWFAKDPVAVVGEIKGPVDVLSSVAHTGRMVEQIRKARLAFGADSPYILFLYGRVGEDPATGYYSRWGWVNSPYGVANSEYADEHNNADYDHEPRPARQGWVPIPIPGTDPPRYKTYREVDNCINSIAELDGVRVKYAEDERMLVRHILDYYHWWQKPREAHTTSTANSFYSPVWVGPSGKVLLARRVAKEIEGIKIERSTRVALRFPTVAAMVNSKEEEWLEIPGIGEGLAERAIRQLWGGHLPEGWKKEKAHRKPRTTKGKKEGEIS